MGHFYTQQKRQMPINYQRQKKKNSAKTSLKNNRKTDGQRMQKKKKNETSGQSSIAYCWHNTNLHMRDGERERERAGWGGWEEEGQRGRRKMVQKNSRTYLLAPVVFTPNAWLPSLKAGTWVVKICSHSLALACLTTLSCRTKLSAPPDIWPEASRLRMLFIMSSCADGDHSETSPPQTLQQRRAWLMTFHCFSKSTVLFDSPSRKKASWDWRVTQTVTVLVVGSLARRFCFSCWGHGVTTEWNIYTKASFKRRKSRYARQHFDRIRELKPFSFTSFGSSVDVNVLRHVDRAAKLLECVAVSMENGRHFGFLSGCAAQDVRATLTLTKARSYLFEVNERRLLFKKAIQSFIQFLWTESESLPVRSISTLALW